MRVKIVFGMVRLPTTVTNQDVEGNRGGVCFKFGGLDRQQQTPDQHADDPRRREYRPRRGYR